MCKATGAADGKGGTAKTAGRSGERERQEKKDTGLRKAVA